jgi:hypothetical protein
MPARHGLTCGSSLVSGRNIILSGRKFFQDKTALVMFIFSSSRVDTEVKHLQTGIFGVSPLIHDTMLPPDQVTIMTSSEASALATSFHTPLCTIMSGQSYLPSYISLVHR